MAEKDFVESTISSKPLAIFSKSYCPFCVKVKDLFKNEYQISDDKQVVVELENRSDCSAVQAYLKDRTGASSVPRVFIAGKIIGGCDDTFKLHNSDKLKGLLQEAGAL